jgi:hypothetical protein
MPRFFREISMTEDQFINIILTHVQQQFPKTCNACGRRFSSLKEYLQNTVHVGKPQCYDAEVENWRPHNPLGLLSFSNCKCGSTLVIGTSGIGVVTVWRLLWWIRGEKSRRKVSVNELLNDLRIKVDNQILNEEKFFQNVTFEPIAKSS